MWTGSDAQLSIYAMSAPESWGYSGEDRRCGSQRLVQRAPHRGGWLNLIKIRPEAERSPQSLADSHRLTDCSFSPNDRWKEWKSSYKKADMIPATSSR